MKEFLLNRLKLGTVASVIVILFTCLGKALIYDFSEGWNLASILGSLVIVGTVLLVTGIVLAAALKGLEKIKFL